MKTTNRGDVFLVVFLVAISGLAPQCVQALECSPREFRYGENDIVDELLTCSLSRLFDLDLTPQGDRFKVTSRALVDQGLSNKTTVVHAKLSGLWTAKRPKTIETGWKCRQEEVTSTAIIELSSLSLEVIEKLDIQLHRNQHKLAMHKPCKTFDLPVWMCRQSKPIYRTTSTWANRAYFNMTLVQRTGDRRPTISALTPIFTCPETFKQKITHSPSATYIIARHFQQLSSQPQSPAYHSTSSDVDHIHKRSHQLNSHAQTGQKLVDEPLGISHPSSFATLQSGKMPAVPPYQNSVKLIMEQVVEVLGSSLNNCLNLIDSDLTLVADHGSFSRSKYPLGDHEDDRRDALSKETDEQQENIKNECASASWIRSRIELANEANSINALKERKESSVKSPDSTVTNVKRNLLETPDSTIEEDQLLNPYGNYNQFDSSDRMVDDN